MANKSWSLATSLRLLLSGCGVGRNGQVLAVLREFDTSTILLLTYYTNQYYAQNWLFGSDIHLLETCLKLVELNNL